MLEAFAQNSRYFVSVAWLFPTSRACKNSFSRVSGVMAPRHLPAKLQGAFRTRLHAGVLHLLRPQGKPDESFPNVDMRKRTGNLIKSRHHRTLAKCVPRE